MPERRLQFSRVEVLVGSATSRDAQHWTKSFWIVFVKSVLLILPPDHPGGKKKFASLYYQSSQYQLMSKVINNKLYIEFIILK